MKKIVFDKGNESLKKIIMRPIWHYLNKTQQYIQNDVMGLAC